jgi:hypothetical protein
MQEDDSMSQIPWMLIVNSHTPASADESPLVDRPLCPKPESQHALHAWIALECDTLYFLDCHVPHR